VKRAKREQENDYFFHIAVNVQKISRIRIFLSLVPFQCDKKLYPIGKNEF
jgi:hypothetical protein